MSRRDQERAGKNEPQPTLARNYRELRAIAHFDRVLGRGKSAHGHVSGDGPVIVLSYVDIVVGVIHFATLGFSSLNVTVRYPTELVCSVRPDQAEAGYQLLIRAMQLIEQNPETPCTFGTNGEFGDPVVGTALRGVLFTESVWSDELTVVWDPREEVELVVFTVLPLLEEELAFIAESDMDAWDEELSATSVDVFDLHRTQPITLHR
ncbi:MAG: suppressor of fused domain protein [Jatrophihabitans sp.]